jgi:hypothetical protein
MNFFCYGCKNRGLPPFLQLQQRQLPRVIGYMPGPAEDNIEPVAVRLFRKIFGRYRRVFLQPFFRLPFPQPFRQEGIDGLPLLP